MERYELVSRIVKVRGLEGKVTAKSASDLPFRLYAGLSVHVVPPSLRGPRHLSIRTAEQLTDGTWVLAFDGVTCVDDAEQLVGRYLLAAALDVDFGGAQSPDFWLGRSVLDDVFGELGAIEELIATPAHDVWVVRGARGEVLVPVVDEFIYVVPEDANEPIRTCIPEGLVAT